MFGVRTLRIRSSLLASAAAVATVAAALAAGSGEPPALATKGDRLPLPETVHCAGVDCAPPVSASYRTIVEHDRAGSLTTLTRIPTDN